MTPGEYCRNKAAPPGSNLYYSTLFHASASRPAIHALFALSQELSDALYHSSDPDAAKITLGWWLEEIQRLFAGQPRHPVTRELQRLRLPERLEQRDLEDCVVSHAQLLETADSISYTNWLARHVAGAGYPWKAAGQFCGCKDPEQLKFLEATGCCHGAVEQLRRLGRFTERGVVPLPADMLSAAGGAAVLATRESDAAARDLFRALFTRLERTARICQESLSDAAGRQLLFAVVMLEMLATLCRKYREARHPAHRTRLSLSPIRKLWIAWRIARKH